jgi:hypothetical protein
MVPFLDFCKTEFVPRHAALSSQTFPGAKEADSWVSVNTYLRLHSHSLTHGAEPLLRSRQLSSHSRTSQHFMEPESSLPCSQEPCTCSYSEPRQSNPYIPSYLSKIHLNIVHPPTSWSSQWSLSFWLSHRNLICIPLLPQFSFPLLTEISLRRQRHSLENKTAEESLEVLKTQIHWCVTS